MDDPTDDLAYARTEGFPCQEADTIEDLVARLHTVCGDLGLTALHLRSKARMRFNAQRRAIAAGRHPRTTQDASLLEQRSA